MQSNRTALHIASHWMSNQETKMRKKLKQTHTLWIGKIILFIFIPHFLKHQHYLHDYFFLSACCLCFIWLHLATFGYICVRPLIFLRIQSFHFIYKIKQKRSLDLDRLNDTWLFFRLFCFCLEKNVIEMDVAFYFLHFFSFLRDTKSLRFNIFNFSSALKWFCVSKSGVCSFVFVGLSEPLSFNTLICLIVSKMICMIPSVLCLLVRLYEFGWRLFVIVVDFFPGSVELRLTYGKKMVWHSTKLASECFQINFFLRVLNSGTKKLKLYLHKQ